MREGCLYHDAPIEGRDDDLLGRAAVADRLASLISEDPGRSCCSIGVVGPRGSGKTSVINMVRERLQESDDVFVLTFDPTLYRSGSNVMALSFFRSITADLKSLSKGSQTLKEQRPRYGRIAGDTLKVVDRTVKMKVVGELSDLSGSIVTAGDEPIMTIREKISEQLRKSGCKLVIVIDSLDLLTPKEQTQLFRLIDATARFDNTFYILGYDEKSFFKVCSNDIYSLNIQKIVQLEVRLPDPDERMVKDALRTELPKVMGRFGLEPSGYTAQACGSISPRNLRDVYRLLNGLAFKLSVRPDLCCEDLLALTYVELASPAVYDWILKNRRELCDADANPGIVDEFRRLGADERVLEAAGFLYPSLTESGIVFEDYGGDEGHVRSASSCDPFFYMS